MLARHCVTTMHRLPTRSASISASAGRTLGSGSVVLTKEKPMDLTTCSPGAGRDRHSGTGQGSGQASGQRSGHSTSGVFARRGLAPHGSETGQAPRSGHECRQRSRLNDPAAGIASRARARVKARVGARRQPNMDVSDTHAGAGEECSPEVLHLDGPGPSQWPGLRNDRQQRLHARDEPARKGRGGAHGPGPVATC
jgi:hypothetical protein